MSEKTKPIIRTEMPRMLCAATLGVHPSWSMAARTRARTSPPPAGTTLTTRETVAIATAAARATRGTATRLRRKVWLRRTGSGVEDDESFFGHLAHRVIRAFLAEAAVLDAAKRHHVRACARGLIDLVRAEAQGAGRLQRAIDVLRED